MEEVQTALCGSAHLMLLVQQMCSLEIRALFLQFAVVHVNCEKLVLISWAQLVPGLWVVLAIPADIRVFQGQASEVQDGHGYSSTDEGEKGDQSRVVSELLADHGKHVDGR